MTPPDQPRAVPVWDLPIRLFHWSLAAMVAVAWISGRLGKLDPHMKIGAAILALLLFRLAWGATGSGTARFASFVKGPGAVIAYLRGQWRGLGHNPMGALSVLAMLGLLLAQAGTGLFATDDIASDGPLAWMLSSAMVKKLSAWHRLGSWLVLALVGLHLSAIAFYRFKQGENLVEPMITGVKVTDEAVEPPLQVPAWRGFVLMALSLAVVFGGLAVWGK